MISTLLVSSPSGLWANIINGFVSFTVNYAWAIILLTICIKLILSPFDFLNKKTTRNMTRQQTILGPQLAKLQKQYANDRNMLNQKTSELYKANGVSMGGSCFSMLIYLVLTMVIFISLFTSLNSMAVYKNEAEYLDLKNTYDIVYNETEGDTATKTSAAEEAVLVKYDNRTSTFLWIKNVWQADTPFKSAVLDFDNYLSSIGNNVRTDISQTEDIKINEMSVEEKETFLNNFKEEYNKVMKPVLEQRNGVNGYFLITLLSVATAFFSQYLMQKQTSRKAKRNLSQKQVETAPKTTNKFMLIILPVIMGIITLFYNAVFGLYIIAGQIVSMLTFPIIDSILDKIDDKKDKERDAKIMMDYRRK